MEDDNTTRQERQEEGQTNARNRSAWVRSHLSDSVYLWACGEKANDEEDDPTPTDMFIGWFILLLQGFAYGMLIFLARTASSSDTDSTIDDDDDEEDGSRRSEYILASVTGAMYLLVASTSHDIRAGFSLSVDGSRACHRAFGVGLLFVYVIMITAAMTVLVSTSNDSTSVVLNGVAVLFIADLDEKALKFFSTIPQKWRLFWAMESIGISFSLALVAFYSIGDSFPLLAGGHANFDYIPSWALWVLNPAGVTMCAYRLSTMLQHWCESCSGASENVDQLTLRSVVISTFAGLLAAMRRAKQFLRRTPCFYAALGVWLVQGVYSWWNLGAPVAFYNLCPCSGFDIKICVTGNGMTFAILNAMVVAGIVMKVLSVFCLRRHELAVAIEEPCRYSDAIELRNTLGSWAAESRLPSLFVGWGLGYWVTSLLYYRVLSWNEGGWDNAPIAVTVLTYLTIPCFILASIFMVADTDVLGTRFGAFIKPAVDVLTDRRRIVYWIMASVLRDVFLLWTTFLLHSW